MKKTKINKSQDLAIHYKEGPLLVLAGPGSGKTFVITERIRFLTEECGIRPERILVITFTKAAATEMKERYGNLVGTRSSQVNFGTFHAVFFKILKYAYHYDASSILREEERRKFIKEIIIQMSLDIEDEGEFIENILSEISLVKGERIDMSHYYSINCPEETFQDIYVKYEKMLRSTQKIDFDDMLTLCFELLTARKDILFLWQQKYEYILIDEMQDINKIQYDIICLLAKPQDNLFVVGDDDQSIYRFRGAKPEIMLNFQVDYPQSKRILLNKNYRSTASILKAASNVIKNNKNRFDKRIEPVREEGERIEIKNFQDITAQNEEVLRRIQIYHKQGIAYSEIAVLFRTNTQAGALLTKFMDYNIPFKIKDTIPNVYDHWIAKNIICYLKLAIGSRERGLFLQIINRPKRYISRECFEDPIVDFEKLKDFYSDRAYVGERIDKLEMDLKILSNLNPYAAINYLRRAVGYDAYIAEYAEFRRMKPEELLDLLGELQERAREFDTFEEWFSHMEEYKKELKLQLDQRNNQDIDGVALSTYHASKGLEYETVFLVDVNETITPHRKALLEADLEEERRMFYVAMTRAKNFLHIYYSKERFHKEFSVSRFLEEMVEEEFTYLAGDKLCHKTYGIGILQKIDGDRLIIQFKNAGIHVLSKSYCVKNKLFVATEA